jgi:hypothetical protein
MLLPARNFVSTGSPSKHLCHASVAPVMGLGLATTNLLQSRCVGQLGGAARQPRLNLLWPPPDGASWTTGTEWFWELVGPHEAHNGCGMQVQKLRYALFAKKRLNEHDRSSRFVARAALTNKERPCDEIFGN